jgi:DNA repair ATPase RecN
MDLSLDHEKRLTAVEESTKQAHKRIDEIKDLNESVKNLAISVAEMTVQLSQVKESTGRIEEQVKHNADTLEAKTDTMDTRLKELEGKSGKRWELVVTEIIKLLVAGGLGYFISILIQR